MLPLPVDVMRNSDAKTFSFLHAAAATSSNWTKSQKSRRLLAIALLTWETRGQKRFTISEVAANWLELMIPQRTMQPSIACASEQIAIVAAEHPADIPSPRSTTPGLHPRSRSPWMPSHSPLPFLSPFFSYSHVPFTGPPKIQLITWGAVSFPSEVWGEAPTLGHSRPVKRIWNQAGWTNTFEK